MRKHTGRNWNNQIYINLGIVDTMGNDAEQEPQKEDKGISELNAEPDATETGGPSLVCIP